jgi:hypothetical protein
MQRSTQWERSHRGQAVRPLGVPPAVIWLCAGAVLMLMSIPRLGAQDPLASARSLYASAAYDEALKTLQELSSEGGGRIAGASFREVEEYRFLCLLALGRNAEARESISAVVTADPLYKLDENTTSPRVLNAFRAVRREVLPDILTNIFNAGKSMYDAKDFKGAEPQFRKVIGLAGDPDLGGKGGDMVTLAKGFLDLAVAANTGAVTATPAPAAPAATNAGGTGAAGAAGAGATPAGGNAAAAAGAPTTQGNAGAASAAAYPNRTIVANQPKAGEIVPPRLMKRTIPNVPSDLSRFGQLRPGEMEILIDETGKVTEAKFTKPIHPIYDSLVIAATRSWRYEPARADGVPVKFRINLKVTISETNRNQEQQ